MLIVTTLTLARQASAEALQRLLALAIKSLGPNCDPRLEYHIHRAYELTAERRDA